MRKLLIALVLLFALATPSLAQDNATMLAAVRAARNNYPEIMTREQAAEMLNTVAATYPGWGMLQKGSGNSCPLRGVYISCDILIHKGATDETSIHYDVASGADFGDDAHGRNMGPVFNPVGPCVLGPSSGCSMTKFLAPVGVTQPTNPVPPVVTVPGPVTPTANVAPQVLEFMGAVAGALDSIQAKIDYLRTSVDSLTVRLDGLQAQIALLPSQITVPALSKVVFPTYKATIFGQSVTLTPQAVK